MVMFLVGKCRSPDKVGRDFLFHFLLLSLFLSSKEKKKKKTYYLLAVYFEKVIHSWEPRAWVQEKLESHWQENGNAFGSELQIEDFLFHCYHNI